MFSIGTREGDQSKNVQKYLDVKYMDLEYNVNPDNMGFVLFEFPTLDEEGFRKLFKKSSSIPFSGIIICTSKPFLVNRSINCKKILLAP